MNRGTRRCKPMALLSALVGLAILLSACSPAAPAAAPQPTQASVQPAQAVPTSAPGPAAAQSTQAPAAAPAPTSAPAAPTAAPAASGQQAPAAQPVKYVGADPIPAKFTQAPQLAEQVMAGKLPPVEKRLPEKPLVVPVVDSIGQYGGVWRRGFIGPSDYNNYVRVVYDSLFRFSPDGARIEPKVAEGYEISKDYSTWTIKLRKGAKWSDGEPMTADDILFWYKDVLLNKEITPALPPWMKNADGSPALVEKLDDYTVRWTFKEPHALFLIELANKDGGDRTYAVFLPSHYLKQFHPNYVAKADLDKLVADTKAKTWVDMFATKNAPFENPDRPTMAAWTPATRISEQVFTLKRNPYYVGVDPQGNQLPYVDEIHFTFFSDLQALNLAAIAGNLDEQDRHINMMNYPVLKENETKLGKYRILTWPTFGGNDAAVFVNQTFVGDSDIANLLRVRDFRLALSNAINRPQIKESAFMGLGEIRQPVAAPWHPYYPGDAVAFKYTEYKPDEANKLLDQVGLDKRDAEGFRLLPNGKKLTLELTVVAAFGPWPDVGQLIVKDFQKVGLRTLLQIRESALVNVMQDSGELQMQLWNNDTSGFPFTGNSKFDPRKSPQPVFAPQYRKWFASGGKEGPEPPAELKKVVELIDKASSVGTDEQANIAKELFTTFVENQWQIGTVGLTPMVQGVVVVNKDMRNVPSTLGNDWPLRTPGDARTEQFYYAK